MSGWEQEEFLVPFQKLEITPLGERGGKKRPARLNCASSGTLSIFNILIQFATHGRA